MSEKGLLIVVSGPSGVGKDTIVEGYLKGDPHTMLSVSATTREPRQKEADGVDYHFIPKEKFLKLIDQGEFLEHAEYNGNHYGTLRSAVANEQQAGKNVILIIETKGASLVKQLIPEAVLVFIMPPSFEKLTERLNQRQTEPEEIIKDRLHIANDEIKLAKAYDYVIINDNISEAVQTMDAIIKAAFFSPKHNPEILKRGCKIDA